MLIKINGVPLTTSSVGVEVPFVSSPIANNRGSMAEKVIPATMVATTTALMILTPGIAFASGFDGAATGGWRIIHLLQQGAFWVGLAVSIWGVYEWQVGGPGWKDRLLKGFLGYVLIMILPVLFLAVKEAFAH